MPTITFIHTADSGDKSQQSDGARLIAAALDSHWTIQCVEHESIHASASAILSYGWREHASSAEQRCLINLDDSDLIWLFGLGERQSFLDRMQLLNTIAQEKFVNRIDAITFAYGKQGILRSSLAEHHPESLVSNNKGLILKKYAEGGDWILKPTAGSFGRGVFILPQGNPDVLRDALNLSSDSGYLLLQRKVDTSHEKRWLLVNGRVIGAYGKRPLDHRGNLEAGSQPLIREPTVQERKLAEELARKLIDEGIRYAAVDIAHPYLLDVNFVNPGWLTTYKTLTGEDKRQEVLDALFQ